VNEKISNSPSDNPHKIEGDPEIPIGILLLLSEIED
jgi:hypothetical protein